MQRIKMRTKLICVAAAAMAFASQAYCGAADGQQGKRPFTLRDDIGFTHFVSGEDGYSTEWPEGIQFSPNGDYVTVLTAQGRLDLNQVEETLRFYRVQDIEAFLKQPGESPAPSPIWEVSRKGKKEPISHFGWLPDSSGIVLLEYTDGEYMRLVLVDLRKKTTEVLTEQIVRHTNFGVSDREHYVYVAEDQGARKELEEKREAELQAPMRAFTGGTAWWNLLKPENPGVIRDLLNGRNHLWAVQGGQPFEVKHDGAPLDPADFNFRGTLSLSPDGQSIVTRMRVKNISQAWEKVYLPPYASTPYNNIHVGGSASEFVRIDLKTGAMQPLMDAPPAGEADWPGNDYGAEWSSDGRAVVLSGTFLESKDGRPTHPCVAVVELPSLKSSCVEKLRARRGPNEELSADYRYVMSARFVEGDKNRVEITFADREEAAGTVEYRRTGQGDWQVAGEQKGIHRTGRNGVEISVKQAFDQPPLLVASEKGKAKVIWDPNPEFRQIELGQAKIYRWKDKEGRDWEGGLYLPASYRAGQRYPLVIQTHGFTESVFTPSGAYSTAFAARELAAAGIAVLQVGGAKACGAGPDEASCEVAGFEAGARQLATDGIVDLQRVGYIGFSHSVWYGMEFLTNGSLPLRAVLLADGIMVDYLQFALNGIDFKTEIGAKPFGEGLETWVKRSPGFHLDKVTAPLLIDGQHDWVLQMWQPYVGLKYLKKPVELDLINTDEHVITNPVERMASQGLTVDWFRFWLQDHEDANAAKKEQYARWQSMRELQAENEKKASSAEAAKK